MKEHLLRPSRTQRSLPFLLLAASWLPVQLSAQDPETDDDAETPTVKAEITVTSTLPEITGSETLEPRELEARGVDDLAAGLRSTAGLDAVRRGAVNLDPTVRGLQDGQVGLFVNGTRTFAAGPARMDSDLSHLSLHDVQELRVVKGPYALSWGAGALSAIDAVTYRPDFSAGDLQLGASAHGGYESNRDASDLFARLSGSSERFRFTVSGGRREGSDYEDGAGSEVPADYESDHVGGTLGLKLGQGLLQYDASYQGQDDLDYAGRLLDATYFKTRSHRLEYSWAGDGLLSGVQASGYSNAKDHLMNNDEKPTARDMAGRTPPFALDIALPTESNTVGGAVRAELDLGSENQLAMGVDVYHVDQVADRFVRRRSNGFLIVQDAAWPETDLDNLGVWAQWNRNFDRAALGAAVRFDSNRSESRDVSEFFAQNAGSDLERSADTLSVALSGSFELSSRWTLQGGLGRAVRNPTTLELYSDRFPATKFQIPAEFVGDPNLEEEVSHEVNAGVVGSWGSLVLRTDLFYRQIDDYITVAADPALPKKLPLSPNTVYRYVNGDEARFWGGELRLDQRVSPRFSWRVQLDSTRATDEAFDEPVLGITPLRATAAARWSTSGSKLWGELEAVVLDDQERVASSRFEQTTPGTELLNLALGAAVGAGVEVTVFGRNLTDEDYAYHLNAPVPFTGQRVREIGRSVGVTVRYNR